MNKLYVVGLGPGGAEGMTAAARAALDRADLLCGYTRYLDLVRPLYPDKAWYATLMTGELDRCRYALKAARGGKTVAMVCGGDPGVYGMAGPLLELAGPDARDVEVVPGVTAALSGGAVLGAPLMHDFCLISLSDRLTPWERIEGRLRAAAMGDFVICLYNPASHGRPGHLRRACGVLLEAGLAPGTPCGWVRNIGRPGEEARVLTLSELRDEPVDMFTTVFIGNSQTEIREGRLVTPRGYREET